MIRLIFVLILVHLVTSAVGQPSLCLSKATAINYIDLRPDELNDFLHLDKYRIIFFGEQHNDRLDPEIKYYLITDLNKRTGLRHVFLETSFSVAWNLNQYLRTGDTTYLYNPAWSRIHTPYSYLWSRLYEYNKGLPEDRKIVIYGVDFETTSVFLTLKRLSPKGKVVPALLRPVIDTIDAHVADPPLAMWKISEGKFIEYNNVAFINALRYVQTQLLAHPDITEAYFGNNYSVVRDIATNNSRVEVRARHRNKTMFAAMEQIIREQKIDRFIGFFGGQHTTYMVGNSLTNAAASLKGFRKSDILNIAEFAYNINTKDTAFRRKRFHEIVTLNSGCKATLLPAGMVPDFRKEADFVIIADISK